MGASLKHVFGPLWRSFAPGRPYDIGLHIGLESVNLMQLQPGKPRPTVRAAASLAHGTSRDELIADPARLKALIKRAFAAQPFRGNRVVTCLPNDQMKILLLTYTMSDGISEADAVVRELRERMRQELDGMVVDYIPLRQEHASRPKEAIVAMAARDKVTAYLNALSEAGLEAASLDIAPAALARLLSWISAADLTAHPNLLLINFGARCSYLTVVWGRRLMLDRSIEFAEERLLARLKNILDIPEATGRRLLLERGFSAGAGRDDANELTHTLKETLRPEFAALKREVDETLLDPRPQAGEPHAQPDPQSAERGQRTDAERGAGSEISDALKEVLRPEFAALKAEVDNTLVYTASRAHGRTVDRIYVVGSIARYPGIEHLLREQFSLPLEILDPFSIFPHRLSEQELSWLWPLSGVAAAAGLALRGSTRAMADIDLIPADYAKLARVRRRMKPLAIALIGLALVIGLARLALTLLISFEQANVAQLQKEGRISARGRAEADALRQQKQLAEKQLAELDELRGRDRLKLLLRAIDAAYSDSIWLEQLRFFRRDPPAGDVTALPGGGRSGIIVVPKPNVPDPAGAPPAAGIEHRAEIVGHATSHTRLAEFMRVLGSQAGIAQVRLVDTGLGSYSNVPVVDLTLMLLVDDKAPRPQ